MRLQSRCPSQMSCGMSRHANALEVDDYDGEMDFVVGNPQYVRVHNLADSFNRVKRYHFCADGMTDLYLVFYEIGLGMLRDGGRPCYISPSSWFNSLAGRNMREAAKNRMVAGDSRFRAFPAVQSHILYRDSPL